MPLTEGKQIVQGSGRGLMSLGVVAAATLFQGGIAMLSSGFARAARVGQGATDWDKIGDVAASRVLGIGQQSVTGGAANGDVLIDAQSGDFVAKNSAGVDAITVADIGRYCFIVDDETVARLSAGGTRPRGGVVVAVDASGVLVRMAPEIAAAAPRILYLPWSISETDTLAGTSAEQVCPVSGWVHRNSVIVQKTVTTGGDVTVSVGGAAVDGLACTIADGAAKGTIVTDTPPAGHASTLVPAGSRIQIIPAAAFATAGALSGVLEIAY